MSILHTIKADPWNEGRLFGDSRFSVQNMLVRNCGFPAQIEAEGMPEMFFATAFSDLVPIEDWQAAMELIPTKDGVRGSLTGWLRSASRQNFLKFCSVAGATYLGLKDKKLRRARIVRGTNVSSGHPVYRIDIVKPDSPKFEIVLEEHPAPKDDLLLDEFGSTTSNWR